MKKTRRPRTDYSGLAEFMAEHEAKLVKIAYRLTRDADTARDLVQDSMLRACERFHQFKGGNLGGWIYTIIRNSWTEHCRVRSRQTLSGAMLGAREAFRETTQDRAELCIVLQDVLRLLRDLPRYQRRAITAISTGSTYKEAARRYRITAGAVKSATSRARETLAEAI